MDRTTISLDGQWRLDFFPQPQSGAVRSLPLAVPHETVSATVPGNCELDLMRAGLLPEPEVGLNALQWRRYEGHQWLYTRSFKASAIQEGGRAILRFEGIDTLADIFLNGAKIGETSNMLVSHRFDVTDLLRQGENTVQVLIRSAFLETKRHTAAQHSFMWGTADGAPLRKAAYMGGWDIFPRLYVSGLWRSVAIDVEGQVRIEEIAFVSGDYARDGATGENRCRVRAFFRVDAPMERYLDGTVVRVSIGDVASTVRPLRTVTGRIDFEASGFGLWWPADAGEHPLYEASIEVVAPGGEVLARETRRIGFRTIELLRDDNYGPRRPGIFLFRVNGEPIYIRGTNWVPADAIPSRQAARILPTLALVEESHCNLVRVWGGGVYEPDFFYDWCDEHGVLVWQDFMTGCAQTPQGDAYASATEAEVRAVALRLRNHPSLAIWAGNNENDDSIGWARMAGVASPDPGTDRASREAIPRVLREIDPTRPYLPSSPYISPDVASGRAKPSEAHLWGARDWYKSPFYLEPVACFASETGWHGCPGRDSLEKTMTPGCVYPWKDGTDGSAFDWNDEWRFKAENPFLAPDSDLWFRNDLMTRQVARLFGSVPRDLDAFIAASQFFQAEALKTMVERFRASKFAPFGGLVWWNVRDGWPQISDAVVDWHGGRKAAFAALRDAQRPILALVLDDHSAWLVNDSLREVAVRAVFRDQASGATLLEGEWSVAANASLRIGDVAWPEDGHGFIDIEYSAGDAPAERSRYLYGKAPFGLEFTLPEAPVACGQ